MAGEGVGLPIGRGENGIGGRGVAGDDLRGLKFLRGFLYYSYFRGAPVQVVYLGPLWRGACACAAYCGSYLAEACLHGYRSMERGFDRAGDPGDLLPGFV